MTTPAFPQLKTVGALVAWARQALERAGVDHAAQEAAWLLGHALGLKRHQLVSQANQFVLSDVWPRVESLILRRVSREPLQYLLGTQEFCGLDMNVNPAVLIPRPETELLVQEVIRLGGLQNATLVDVGTGSGCLAITVATIVSEARILAIDQSPDALAVARNNARRHGVVDKIEWLEGDLLAPLRERMRGATVDVILSNPPYIAEADWAHLQPEVHLFEPRLALVGGPKGTEFHERLLADAQDFLVPGGVLMMEIGQGQAPAVRQAASRLGGYHDLRVVEDAAGMSRVVIAHRRG